VGVRTVLAVDAGNSKTDVAVVDGDGRLLGSARGGGFQPPAVGVEAAVDALGDLVARARKAARAAADLDGEEPAAHLSACLANADLPREEAALSAALVARGWAGDTQVANDTFAVLRAGLPDDGSVTHGVAVVCGAGVNCVGRDAAGRTHRFAAVGALSGDWGGGMGLVDAALWHAARAEDGRGEPTALAEALPAHFGLPSMAALIEALHLRDLPRSRRHELAPVLFAAAADGDAVARSLVARQADELAAMVHVSLSRLDLLGTPTPVLLGGSVLAARHPLLDARLHEALSTHAPQAQPHLVTAPPVLGAALLGLDALHASPTAYARLRSHFA
jgi:N-acetylglucosamine kinase-like BadF-type ATPase